MNDYTDRAMDRADLIAAMTQDLTPVSRVKPRDGLLLIGIATLVAAAAAIAIFGFWAGMITGEASGFFWIINGLLLVLGAASGSALVASALPRVGSRSDAPVWNAAMLAVIPIAAILTLLSQSTGETVLWAWECAAYGIAAGLIVGASAVLFLRRGAPVSIERAGWLTGIAAGSLGSLAYGITCPLDTITHVGLVHLIPVAVSAVIGRLVVPPLIRW